MKVYQQADSNLRESQVGQDLCFVYGRKLRNSLELDDQGVAYYQVGPVGSLDAVTIVHNRQGRLAPEHQATLVELDAQAGMVGALEEPAAEALAHLDGCADDRARELCLQHHGNMNAVVPFPQHPSISCVVLSVLIRAPIREIRAAGPCLC